MHLFFEYYLTESRWKVQLDPNVNVDFKIEDLAELAALIGLLNPKETTCGSIVAIALNNWLLVDVHSEKGLNEVELFKECLAARESYGIPGAPKNYTVNPDGLPEVYKTRAYEKEQPIVSRLQPRHLATIRAKLPIRNSAKCTKNGQGNGQGQSSIVPWTPPNSKPMAAACSALAVPGSHVLPPQPQDVYSILGQALATAEPSLLAAASNPKVQAMLQDKAQAKTLWKSFLSQQSSPPRRSDSLVAEVAWG